MHADVISCSVSDPFEKDQNVGRESSTPEATPSETCKGTRKFESEHFLLNVVLLSSLNHFYILDQKSLSFNQMKLLMQITCHKRQHVICSFRQIATSSYSVYLTERRFIPLQMGEEWDDSLQSKEQIEASLMHKFEAAMRRERALAYSYTHQVYLPPFYCQLLVVLIQHIQL